MGEKLACLPNGTCGNCEPCRQGRPLFCVNGRPLSGGFGDGMSVAIMDVATTMGFDRERFIEALMAGSAQSFALKVAPGFVRPRSGLGAPGSFNGLHDLLKKDVDHCRKLPPSDPVAMQALLASCEVMLARIRRAADEAEAARST